MSHSALVTLIADQEIYIGGMCINLHDLNTVTLNSKGEIVEYSLKERLPLTEHLGLVREISKGKFNCSEEYFKDITGDNLSEGDVVEDCCYRIFKCKVCGWCFFYTFSTFGRTSDIYDKMRDHVYLKHKQ